MSVATTAVSIRGTGARPWLTAVIVWALLLTVPLWLPMLGGYTALAGRVLVLGLAAMSLNFLLGFTGVLSFGHAAYFGLGAYGAGLALKFVALSTPLALIAGMLLGGFWADQLTRSYGRRLGRAMVVVAGMLGGAGLLGCGLLASTPEWIVLWLALAAAAEREAWV